MDGFHIILYPEDRSWIATPDFIRGLATLLGADKLESLQVYRSTIIPAEADFHEEEVSETILDWRNVSVEAAIEYQRTEAGFYTCLQFEDAPGFNAAMTAADAVLPSDLSEGCIPLEVSFCNGEYVHYRSNDYERLDHSACHVTLSNYLGYPVELDKYLEAFLATDAIKSFLRVLADISSQGWLALINLV